MESSSGEWFLAEPSIVAAIEECHVRQRGAVCPAICREDPFRIWRFNRKRKIARSPYCASESWTEWELALWTNVVPVCKKTGNVRINVTFRCTRITTDIVEKQSECVCSLRIKHSKRMLRITLSSVACLCLPYSSILPHERYWFPERKKNTTCRDVSYNFFKSISHSKKNSVRYHHASTYVFIWSIR